ncbi:hypothetical protein Y032_0002g856 [Ancylostoma ceylanicum]|uniref:Uncharacterized protein n=1 Tax=Ancylostoma ceylanicum TaxID=53326 RepID=A0A016W3M2_9BILA|nr:hypothetical protein Y032_0002g856 [Ancylostoma ceylanicum]
MKFMEADQDLQERRPENLSIHLKFRISGQPLKEMIGKRLMQHQPQPRLSNHVELLGKGVQLQESSTFFLDEERSNIEGEAVGVNGESLDPAHTVTPFELKHF